MWRHKRGTPLLANIERMTLSRQSNRIRCNANNGKVKKTPYFNINVYLFIYSGP